MFRDKCFYGDFLTAGEGMATNVLTDRLKKLEEAEIIKSERNPENQTKKIYSLTEKGLAFLPVLFEIILWGAKYDPETGAPEELIDRIVNDREGLIAEMLNDLRSD